MILELNNIRLRKILYSDTNLIVKWRNSPGVLKNLYFQNKITRDEHLSWMKNFVDKEKCLQFIIEDMDLERAIGTVFIKNIDNINSKGEFGIFIGESFARGKGNGLKATKLIILYAFDQLNLNKIYLTVFKKNIAGIKSYRNSGFEVEGYLREEIKVDGEFEDIVFMSIFNKNYI